MAECFGGVCAPGVSSPLASGGQGGWGGTGQPRSYWEQQAALVRSPDMSAETRSLAMGHQLSQLGSGRYRSLYPETYEARGGYHLPYSLRRGAEQRNEITNLETMMREYTGPEGTYMRWILGKKIEQLRRVEASLRGLNIREKDEPMPIPDWMQPFVTTQTTEPRELPEGARGRRGLTQPRTVMGLRPLGAQTELNPEQMMQMAGFLSAQKGWDLQSKSDLGRFWEPYTRESEAMFSKGATKPRWATAVQR